jgi:hypothetical protein
LKNIFKTFLRTKIFIQPSFNEVSDISSFNIY